MFFGVKYFKDGVISEKAYFFVTVHKKRNNIYYVKRNFKRKEALWEDLKVYLK